MELLERAAQLDDLCATLGQAAQRRGLTVLLSGEAGVGKTSLLRAFTELIASKARVFEGRCDELHTPRTLGPFRDIARICRGDLRGPILDDRDAFIDALIAEMGFAQRPAIVIVEDAHWADHASLDIIRLLARRMPDLPALLVVSYRDDDLSENRPLRRVLGSIAGPAVLRMQLVGLSDAAVAELTTAAGMDPGPVVAAVGGNPFYLSELLAEPGTAVPASVRDAVLARVSSLPMSCRTALGQIAVVPTEVESWLVTAILDDPADLEPAEHRRILEFTYRGLRFRHEIARRVIEGSLSSSQRESAHRRVLAALIDAGGDAGGDAGAECSRLVHHAIGARHYHAVAEFASAAAVEAAEAESHPETVVFAGLALQHGRHLQTPQMARLHGLAAAALYALNRFAEAAQHADHAVQKWDIEGSAPVALAEALLISARMSTLLADPTAARGKAMRAVQILDPLGPSRALALAYSTVAAQDTLLAHFADARGWSERALNLAHETDSEDVVAHALGYRGLVKCSSGNESGFADLQEAVRIAERIDHADYLTVSAHNLAVMLIRFGRVLQAKPYLDIAEQVALDHRLEAARFRIEAQQCHVLIWQGLWDEAERRLRVLVESAADAGASAVNPLAFLGRVLSRRGDPAAARLIERGWELAVASGEDQKRAVAAAARIERLWLTGDRAAVRTVGTELLPVAVRTRHHVLHAEVLRYLRRAGVQVVTFPGCPPPFAAGIGGDWQIAADLWERAGNPYEQALELSESPNVAVVVQALNILDRLGATAASAIVRRRLRRDGVRNIPRGPRSTTKVNPGQLTDRQLEILSLLDEGCTSAEIADRLFLSRRTVDNHVSAVLHRLGVTSRRAALDVAARAAFLRREAREN